MRNFFNPHWKEPTNMAKINKVYNIMTQRGELYDTVRISGQDEDDCKEQIDLYLTTKGDCYSEEVEQQPRRNGKRGSKQYE
jgi:hypothetical protein